MIKKIRNYILADNRLYVSIFFCDKLRQEPNLSIFFRDKLKHGGNLSIFFRDKLRHARKKKSYKKKADIFLEATAQLVTEKDRKISPVFQLVTEKDRTILISLKRKLLMMNYDKNQKLYLC